MEPAEAIQDQSSITVDWATIAREAPQLRETMARYLAQAGTFLAPASVSQTRQSSSPSKTRSWPMLTRVDSLVS